MVLLWEKFPTQSIQRDELAGQQPRFLKPFRHQHNLTNKLKVRHHHGTGSETTTKQCQARPTEKWRNTNSVVYSILKITLQTFQQLDITDRERSILLFALGAKLNPVNWKYSDVLSNNDHTWKVPSSFQAAPCGPRNLGSWWWRCRQWVLKWSCLPWNWTAAFSPWWHPERIWPARQPRTKPPPISGWTRRSSPRLRSAPGLCRCSHMTKTNKDKKN